EPQKGGEEAYQLLLRALEKTKTAGLATFVMRTADNLAIIRPYGELLLLNTLRFEEEIREASDLKLPGTIQLKKDEMSMAVELIKRYNQPFDISGYHDEYSKDLMKIIRAKAKGKRPPIRKIKVENTKATDLLEKLKASLA